MVVFAQAEKQRSVDKAYNLHVSRTDRRHQAVHSHNRSWSMHDSGLTSVERMLIFASPQQLRHLAPAHRWFMDGTFSMAWWHRDCSNNVRDHSKRPVKRQNPSSTNNLPRVPWWPQVCQRVAIFLAELHLYTCLLVFFWTSLFTTSGSKKLKIQNKQFKQTNKHNVQYTNKG